MHCRCRHATSSHARMGFMQPLHAGCCSPIRRSSGDRASRGDSDMDRLYRHFITKHCPKIHLSHNQQETSNCKRPPLPCPGLCRYTHAGPVLVRMPETQIHQIAEKSAPRLVAVPMALCTLLRKLVIVPLERGNPLIGPRCSLLASHLAMWDMA